MFSKFEKWDNNHPWFCHPEIITINVWGASLSFTLCMYVFIELGSLYI